jgi:hypothetical protein
MHQHQKKGWGPKKTMLFYMQQAPSGQLQPPVGIPSHLKPLALFLYQIFLDRLSCCKLQPEDLCIRAGLLG